MAFLSVALSAALLVGQVQAQQRSFAGVPAQSVLELPSDEPASLNDLSIDIHTAVYHERFPDHRVRIKETTGYCDPDVRSFTGYLDVDSHGKNLWFQFFESRSKPEEDDVLMWINGGPGASSSMGLYMELGPCTIEDPTSLNGTKPNPFAWNTNLNTFFLDQPVGVGLSFAESGQEVARTEQAALDLQAFVAIFFEKFKEFRGRRFHLSGESYGGRYLPIFGAAVLDGNQYLKHPINLASVIIGNGVVDRLDLTTKHYDLVCTKVSELEPVLGVAQCAAIQSVIPRCEEMLKANCADIMDALGCQNAINFCYQHIKIPYYNTDRSPFDMSQPRTIYDKIEENIALYLNLPEVRAHLGIHNGSGTFYGSSSRVAELFAGSLDHTGRTTFYVSALLERGIKVLIYAGMYDYQCGWPHQVSWTHSLPWSNSSAFTSQKLKPWYLDSDVLLAREKGDEVKGESKTGGGLTLASVRKAGHMVPHDKPEESLVMLTRWLEKGHL